MQELLSLKDLPVIDLQTVESIRKISKTQNLLANLVKIFLEDSPKRITEILDAVNNNNLKSFYQASHSLRSSSANIGAERLSKLCRFLENQGRSEIMPDLENLKSQLLKEYNSAKDNLLFLVSQDDAKTQ